MYSKNFASFYGTPGEALFFPHLFFQQIRASPALNKEGQQIENTSAQAPCPCIPCPTGHEASGLHSHANQS
ncbi:MAG: hypothetical protein B6245_21400 [Desulfobacteraceae bacterium 4572_88]|nr:MAG: hypothetical protein B6245_21400 [Desulfobacteraceae bacterium 4572_88]RLC21570.1 MAG: hypothetical protein DRI57_02020 [Deltaproteobacteria bacterium]